MNEGDSVRPGEGRGLDRIRAWNFAAANESADWPSRVRKQDVGGANSYDVPGGELPQFNNWAGERRSVFWARGGCAPKGAESAPSPALLRS